MASPVFDFAPRWKEELVVTGPGGSFILELVLAVYLPTEEVWPTIAPDWAVAFWPELKAELEQWCAANKAGLKIDPTATVSTFTAGPFDSLSSETSGRLGPTAWWIGAVLLFAVSAWLSLRSWIR